jgi:hypothetical protein
VKDKQNVSGALLENTPTTSLLLRAKVALRAMCKACLEAQGAMDARLASTLTQQALTACAAQP